MVEHGGTLLVEPFVIQEVERSCYSTDPAGLLVGCTSTTRGALMSPYQTVQHRPGPSWQPGVAFREQPGGERHSATMRRWLEDGVPLVGGPYLDDGGGGSPPSTPRWTE